MRSSSPLNLQKFQRLLIDAPGPMRNPVATWLASRIPLTWSIVPGILSKPRHAIDGSFTLTLTNAGFRQPDWTNPDLELFPPLCHSSMLSDYTFGKLSH
jgi:hypothetical protein